MEDQYGESWPGEPDPCLSIAVRFFFPDDTAYDYIGSHLMKHNVPLFNNANDSVTMHITGSSAEKLNIPLLRVIPNMSSLDPDIDIMVCLDFISRFISVEGCKTHSSLKPGYCYVELNPEDLQHILSNSSLSEQQYTSVQMIEDQLIKVNDNVYIRNSFSDLVRRKLGNIFRHHFASSQNGFSYKQEEDFCEAEVRLAMTGTVGSDCDRLGITTDIVPCLHVPWPVDAYEWKVRTRKNRFPTKSLIQSIIAEGCHVVPKQNKQNQYSHIEWRYSFSLAEVSLARTLLPKQRICYKVAKALVKHQGEKRGLKIQSYLLKNTLFWICEKSPRAAWTLNNLGRLFLCLLDKFLDFLRTHNIPQYFIREHNLIENQSDQNIEKWIRCVRFIRENPIRCMEEFNSVYIPYGRGLVSNTSLIPYTDYVRLFQNRCKTLGDRQSNKVDTIHTIKTSLKYTGFYFATEGDLGMMLTIAKTDCTSNQYHVMLKERDSEDLYGDLNLLKNEYLCYVNWKDNPFSASREYKEKISAVLRAELACICNQMCAMNNNKENRDQLRKEAINHVDIAFSYTNCPWTVQLKCHQLLMEHERYDTAIDVLQKAFSIKCIYGTSVVYNRFNTHSAEETFGMFITAHQSERRYNAFALAYYLLHVHWEKFEKGIEMPNLPKVKEFWDTLGIQSLLTRFDFDKNMAILEGCFLLRYGHMQRALFCFMQEKQDPIQSGFYCWYCVAKLFCKYDAQIQSLKSADATFMQREHCDKTY